MTVVTTTLEFGLVSVPVGLDKVATKNEAELDTATPEGHARVQRYMDAATGELVPEGAEYPKGIFGTKPKDKAEWGDFRPIPAEALKAIEAATKIESFTIEAFVPLDEVPFERAIGCYIIKPQKGVNPKPLALVYEALKATGKAGIFKLTLHSRQYPAVLYAKNGGLYVNTLVWAEDFTRADKADEALAQVEIGDDHLAMAKTLIESMPGTRDDLDALTDDIRPLKADLIESALAGKAIQVEKAEPKKAAAPDDLAGLLAASIASKTDKPKASSKKAPRAKAAA